MVTTTKATIKSFQRILQAHIIYFLFICTSAIFTPIFMINVFDLIAWHSNEYMYRPALQTIKHNSINYTLPSFVSVLVTKHCFECILSFPSSDRVHVSLLLLLLYHCCCVASHQSTLLIIFLSFFHFLFVLFVSDFELKSIESIDFMTRWPSRTLPFYPYHQHMRLRVIFRPFWIGAGADVAQFSLRCLPVAVRQGHYRSISLNIHRQLSTVHHSFDHFEQLLPLNGLFSVIPLRWWLINSNWPDSLVRIFPYAVHFYVLPAFHAPITWLFR